jgi:hypothetical protein
VPKPLTSTAKAADRFDKRDVIYNSKRDEYRCPAGKRAIYAASPLSSSRS